jgi:bud site selection protein 20
MRQRRSRMHKGIRDLKRKYRTRKRTKDLDQIHQDLKEENKAKLLATHDPDLPGLGQHLCIECRLAEY